MKAISIWQPWAELIVIGAKQYETRSWSTKVRGRVLIHASKRIDRAAIDLCKTPPFNQFIDPAKLAYGRIIGSVEIVQMWQTDELTPWPSLTDQERAFGDYSPGRWAWELCQPLKFSRTHPYCGSQGFFDVPDSAISKVQNVAVTEARPATADAGLFEFTKGQS